jgi:predicted transcriptional regulator
VPRRQRKKIVKVTTDREWNAIASVPRTELFLFLSAVGPCSVAELAFEMDCPPDQLYPHLRKLAAVGLVRQVDQRMVGRHRERVFDVVADDFVLDVDPRTGRGMDRLLDIFSRCARRFDALVKLAADARQIVFEKSRRNTQLQIETARLTEAQLTEVNDHLNRVREIFMEGRLAGQGELFSVMFGLTPVVRKRSARARPTQRLEEMRAEREED